MVVVTTVQLHSTKPKFKFCAGSNRSRDLSEIRDYEELGQLYYLGLSFYFQRALRGNRFFKGKRELYNYSSYLPKMLSFHI